MHVRAAMDQRSGKLSRAGSNQPADILNLRKRVDEWINTLPDNHCSNCIYFNELACPWVPDVHPLAVSCEKFETAEQRDTKIRKEKWEKEMSEAGYAYTGPGWSKVIKQAESEGRNIDEMEAGKKWEMPQQLLMIFFGLVVIYGSLFSIGSFVYGEPLTGIISGTIAVAGTVMMFRLLDKLRVDN